MDKNYKTILTREDIKHIEARISSLFQGMVRKDKTTPMGNHSLDVGRRLIAENASAEAVFMGYYHDVVEDVSPYVSFSTLEKIRFLQGEASVIFPSQQAVKVAEQTLMCIYTPEEYAAEDNAISEGTCPAQAKKIRKRMATERWLHSPENVLWVKLCDVRSNLKDMAALSSDWQAQFSAWAIPFRDALEKLLKIS